MNRHEELFRGYKIVAQYWQGTFQGRAWAEGEKICATGNSIMDVVTDLKKRIPVAGAKVPFKDPTPPYFVGTINSVGRVFHRPSCGWMSNVSFESEIRFSTRQAAISQGFSSCHSCRP